MKILDPNLEAALNAGNEPYLQLQYCQNATLTPWIDWPNPLYSYKKGNLEMEVETTHTTLPSTYAIRMKRGAYVGPTAYYVTTSHYIIYERSLGQKNRVILKGCIIPRWNTEKYQINGNQTYSLILRDLCNKYNYSYFFEPSMLNPPWTYNFYPTGRTLVMNSPHYIFGHIRQKLFLYAYDNDDEEICFRQWIPDDLIGTAGYESVEYIDTFDWIKGFDWQYRQLLWRDEAESTHKYPVGAWADKMPVHNLGYLESTDSPPNIWQTWFMNQDKRSFHLKYEDGDIHECNSGTYQIQVYEIMTRAKKTSLKNIPRLYLQIVSLPKFSTTEAGPLPSTIEAAAPYTPLNVSSFNHILSDWDNNLQAAMDTIDDHTHHLITTTWDEIQLRVQCFTPQTHPLQTWEDSAGVALSDVSDLGHFGICRGSALNTALSVTFDTVASATSMALNIISTQTAGFNSYGMKLVHNVSDATVANYAILVNSIYTGATQMTVGQRLLHFVAYVNGTGGDAGGLEYTGISADMQINQSADTLSNVYSYRSIMRVMNAGNITSSVGYLYGLYYTGTGATTTARGIYLQGFQSHTGTGIVTTHVGLDIDNHGDAKTTNAYGIRIASQSGATANNYSLYTNAGYVLFNAGYDGASTFIVRTDHYNAIETIMPDSIKIMNNAAGMIGFYNIAPVVQPSAYTQTYATASKTHANITAVDPGAYGAGANGYVSAAMAAAVHAEVIALRADMVNVKSVLNQVIDDLQSLGLLS